MKMPIIEAYLDDLIKNSTLDVPAWNIEAARKGGKSGWNYIDGYDRDMEDYRREKVP